MQVRTLTYFQQYWQIKQTSFQKEHVNGAATDLWSMDVLKATDKRSCLKQYQQHHRSQSFLRIQKYVSITRFKIFVCRHFPRRICLFSLIVILVSFHTNINVYLLQLFENDVCNEQNFRSLNSIMSIHLFVVPLGLRLTLPVF